MLQVWAPAALALAYPTLRAINGHVRVDDDVLTWQAAFLVTVAGLTLLLLGHVRAARRRRALGLCRP